MTHAEWSLRIITQGLFTWANGKLVDPGSRRFLGREDLIWLRLSAKPADTYKGNRLTGRLNGWIWQRCSRLDLGEVKQMAVNPPPPRWVQQ